MKGWMGALVLSGLCLVSPAGASGVTEGAAQAITSGEIVYLDGDVFVDGRPADVGQTVKRGSTVKTGAAAVCEISLGAQNIIQIQELTTAVLELGALVPGVRVQAGSVAAVLNRAQAISRRGTFRIKTPSAAAGVRGTVFFVKVEDEDNTYVCACNGSVAVAPASGDELTLSATHHTARRFSRDGRRVTVSVAGLLYHDDRVMDELAAKIGFAVPWGPDGYQY